MDDEDCQRKEGKVGNLGKIGPRGSFDLNLSPLEKKVVRIAKKVMKQDHSLNRIKLVSKCFEELNDRELKNLERVIAGLFKKRVLVLKRAIARSELFENANRRRIMEIITRIPGINVSGIMRKLDINFGTVRWHTELMEEFGFIKSRWFGNSKAFYLPGIEEKNEEFYYLMTDETTLDIVSRIRKNQGITFNKLAKFMKLDRLTFSRKLSDLVSSGILQIRYVIHQRCYYLFERYVPLLDGLLHADESKTTP